MPRELDPFRKYVEHLGNSKWKCKFCGTESHGSAPRIRAHLAGIPGYGIKVCEKVDHCVKAEASQKMKDKGSMLDISTEGTSSEGTERIVFGASQIVPQSDDALNPDETQNSNQPACAPQQPSCYWSTGIGTASVCPQDQVFLPHGAMSPLDNLYTSQQPNLWNHGLDLSRGNEIASSSQQFPMDLSSLDLSERQALPELLLSSFPNDQVPDIRMSNGSQEFIQCGGLSNPLLMNITPTGTPRYSNEQYPSFHQQFVGGIFPPELSNLQPFLLENLHKSRDEIVNTFEAIQASELHNLTVGSSLQIGSFLDVDGADRLQDCDQPCVAGVVPVRSNMSPTDTVQHPSQLPPRCDEEDGNDIFPSRAPMDMNPSIAPQHTIVDSLVREASTNTVGPSSSHALVPPQHQSVPHQSINLQRAHQNPTVPSSLWKNHLVTRHPQALMEMDSCMPSSSEAPNNALPPPQILPCGIGWTGPSSLPELAMSEGAPMMSHPNIGNNFEKNRALKRKLESLYSKEAVIKDELEFAASLLLKKPRKEVAKWLANVEKLRIDCTEAASEGCLPPYQQVDILMHEVEDLRRQGNGLFEVRETKASKLLEGKMVGEAFQKNTIKILEYLGGDQISRLGIYGMGGVGKTTIMVHIYNRLLEKKNYGNVFWITVSQDFNTQRLQDAIGKELGWSISQEKDVRKRAAILHDCLMNRGKSTIFLDDVWECFDLNEVGIPVRADGIKLILTTRSFKICCQMHCQEIIKIEPLSHTEAESLFLEELGSEVALNLEIEPFVKSIVKECAGLPLAIIMMSRSMRGVTDVFEWKDSFERLRESDMGQSDMEKDVLMKLKFSYDRLGNHEVQQCFLSCALYPEDKLINKFELMEFFIDQGLIGQWNTREKQHDRGLTLLNILANVCLLEDHGKEMKMHDLIRDMALHIMSGTSIVKARKGLRRIPSEEYWTNALEKVSLMENYIGEFPLNMSPNCPKLSTFLMNSNIWYEVAIPDSFFKQLRELTVLNLSKCTLRELPDSISDLVNLRALLLRRCTKLRRIPYLGKLKSLRKLDIFRCEIVEGLEGLEMLVNLRYLDITRTCIERLPRGTLGALLNLQFLNVQVVNVEDISKLRALETFSCSFEDVDDFNKFVRVVSKQRNEPQYYKLRVDREGSEIYVEANDDARFGNCKRIVCIKSWSHAIVSAGGESNGSGICILIPKDVQKLIASYCNGATNLSDMCPLENLEELDICEWKNLRVLCGEQDEEVINIHDSPTPLLFPSLRILEIKRCPKLKYLFGHGLKFYLPHLQRIKISTCEELVGITVAATSPPPHLPPAFPSLVYISIWECDKMKRVVESMWLPHFPKLRRIDAHNCENMEEIIGGPPPNLLIEEISLEIFEVANCHNMRKLFPHELLIHLRSLQHIDVYGCKEMVELISGVGQGQEGSIMTLVNNSLSPFQSSISLPKLDSLRPHDLPQLKSICEVPVTCDSLEFFKVLREERDEIINIHHCPVLTRIPTPLVFLSLRVLFILNCPKLKYLFGHWPKFSLPHLQDIKICQCQEMVGITIEVMSPPRRSPPAFPSLEGIDIWDCDEMKRAVESEWLPHFPNLRGINVSHCENMEEIIRGPPPHMPVEEISLEWLKVECCHNMRKLFPHEWMLHLRNLQTIKVHRCKGMVEMISGARQGQDGSIMTHVYNTPSPSFQSSISLPKLKFLWLLDLPRLKSICEVPITCDSIERLEVIKCPEMNRIPLQLQFRDIKDLPYIEVEGEEKWKTLIWDHPDAQALQSRLRFDGNRCILEDGRNSQLSESGSESSDTDFKEV